MKQALHRLQIATRGPALIDITPPVVAWVRGQGVRTGLLTVWCCHTSASLTVQENADPTVRADILRYFEAIAPEAEARYAHGAEGADDMPAHLRTMLTQTQISVPVQHGAPTLGTWQAIYLFEHRRRPHERDIVLHLLGE